MVVMLRIRDRATLVSYLLIVSGAVLCAAGVLGWGAAGDLTTADWLPTFTGLLLGTIVLCTGVLSLKRVRAKQAVPYRTRQPQRILGLAAGLLLAGFAVLAALNVGNEEAYRRQANAPGAWGQWGRQDGEELHLEPRGYVLTLLLVCFPGPVSWLAYGSYRLLGDAFDPVSTEVEGPDPMGQIMGAV